jgi:outer membrane cobalamin receptor
MKPTRNHFESCYALALPLVLAISPAIAQTNNPISDSSSTNVTKLETVDVFGKLEAAREQIVPSLGATSYGISKEQIETLPQGENSALNQVILRAPGVAQDGFSQLHIRGEHANLQYRINDVLLPEGITGFGQELDARFINDVHLITGSLPAQYGFRTAGIVDIHTKNGAFEPGGEVSVYGGSYDTVKPSFEIGGSQGKWNYFLDGSYSHNNFGIENPTSSHTPIHDITDQFRSFAYLSYLIDDTSRISLMSGISYADFEIPNTPGLPPGVAPGGTNWSAQLPFTNFNSADLNERQNEQNYYAVAAYQKSVGDFNMQVAAFGRYSSVHFKPDTQGDLFFDGVSTDISRSVYSGGLETDLSYALFGGTHTVRAGFIVLDESAPIHTTTGVFPTDALGNPTGAPFAIQDNSTLHALFFGTYLQDEWKILPKVTLNFGARFDLIDSFVDENQVSPRVNAIYQPLETTALHIGYSRYFTPPALENVNNTSIAKFNGTSNESEVKSGDLARSERADYFDAGVTHKLLPGLQVGVDGYYKKAKNQLDDGFFGASLIPSQFNYHEGEVYGVEFTANYTLGGFSTYANVAVSRARGKDVATGQFLFSADDLAYIRHHWIYLDHDQLISGSFGASYLWKHSWGGTRVYTDALYGSGLRTDRTASDGTTIPNGGSVPAYYSVSLGIEEAFKFHGKERIKARFDVVNITDNSYELRDGSGIGVNAAQFGMRLGFFGGISILF